MSQSSLCLVLFSLTFIYSSSGFKRICYYSIPQPVSTQLQLEQINGTLCTHLLIGFASTVNQSLVPTRPDDIIIYEKAVQTKQNFSDLLVMLSVGGGGNDDGFHESVSTSETRSRFTRSVLELMDAHNFDGLDIDWEFPAWQKHLEDRENFVALLAQLYGAFKNRSRPLVLSVAVAPAFTIIRAAYDINQMRQYVDFINLMSYDFHDFSPIFPFTEYNAPLYKRQSEEGYLATLNTNWSATYWNQWGMSRDKIMVGIPTYSHSYVLADPSRTDAGSPASGTTNEFTYSEVCEFLRQPGTQYVFDEQALVPYAYKDLVWISFDDQKSVAAKARWIKDNNFGGSMTYSLNCDDFSNSCSNSTKFVLQQLIYDILT